MSFNPSVYIYAAALYCEPCGDAIRARLTAEGKAPADVDDESSFDSDDFPKGPYPDGGGEADTPQHCNACSAFLENPLTPDGETYVRETIEAEIIAGKRGNVSEQWEAFYSIEPQSPRAIRLARMSDAMREHADKETGELDAYAWPGGYPVFYVAGDDGVYCPKCINDASLGVDPWCGQVTAYDINYEDPELYCDECNERIESAYAEPDDATEAKEETTKA